MGIFTSNNINFLRNLQSEINDIPWALWEDKDVNDPDYPTKRKLLIGKVMHIQNRLKCYVLSRYGDGDLSKEFSSYTFFTKGYMTNTFNVVNNDAWSSGKKSYLYFIDKLLDFAESEEEFNQVNWRKEILKWLLFCGITAMLIFLLFSNLLYNEGLMILSDVEFKTKIQFILCVIMITANLIWYKNWKDLLPITTSFIGALVGLEI